MDLTEIKRMLRENNGKYVLFDNDRPDMVVFDAKQYGHLVAQRPGTKKKILVTGGAGYIGSHTVADLLEHDYDVVVLDNLSSGDLRSVHCPIVVGDVSDPLVLDALFAQNDFEAVIHFAGSIIVEESVLNPGKYYRNNVAATINLINSMLKHGVGKIVFSSSAAVYGNPRYAPIDEAHGTAPSSPYGETKLAVEKLLAWLASDLSSVSFRYFNAAGGSPELGLGESHPVETHLIPRILKVACKEEECFKIYGSDYPTFDGTAVRDFIHVKDLARAHVLALDKLTEDKGCFVYNVGTGHGSSVAQIVDKVVEITGKMVPVEKAPRRPGDPPELVADSKKIAAELNFVPKHSDIETIISSAWDWYRMRQFNASYADLRKINSHA